MEKGEQYFQTCLLCHAVGDKGFDIAPALDGSSTRELHALLTAIVNPDIAVEGGYNLHRIEKKDGSVLDGYLYKAGDTGLTMAVMGGAKIFVPKGEIKKEGAVDGKSFMPSIFASYDDQTMVDLVSYIKTLK